MCHRVQNEVRNILKSCFNHSAVCESCEFYRVSLPQQCVTTLSLYIKTKKMSLLFGKIVTNAQNLTLNMIGFLDLYLKYSYSIAESNRKSYSKNMLKEAIFYVML